MQCANPDVVIDQLKQREIEFVERSLPDFGYRQLFFRDPDGNLIELGTWPDVHEMVSQHENEAMNRSAHGEDEA